MAAPQAPPSPALQRVDAALTELMGALTAADQVGEGAAAMSSLMARASELLGFDVSSFIPMLPG